MSVFVLQTSPSSVYQYGELDGHRRRGAGGGGITELEATADRTVGRALARTP